MQQELDLGLRALGGICGFGNVVFVESVFHTISRKKTVGGLETAAKVKTGGGKISLNDLIGCAGCGVNMGAAMVGTGLGVTYPWTSICTSVGLGFLWGIDRLQRRFE